MRTEEHLGGYVPGGDEATYFPELWSWMVDRLGARSVLDIGCGEGHALRYFRDELGCDVVGIDGVPQDDPDIVSHDYTMGPTFGIARYFDIGWMCEFVEHLEERHLPHIVDELQACRYVFFTHAFPGQGGHHHVNCREPEYWKGFFAATGFSEDRELTSIARIQAAVNPSPWNHFVRSGLVFVQ